VHEKLDFTQTIRAIQAFQSRHPETIAIWIENRANGAAAISILSHQIPGICKVSPSKSKYDWAFASSDELNAGNRYLPHPQLASGSRLSCLSLCSFPRGEDDDFVDAWTQAREMLGGADYNMFTSALRVASFPIIPSGLAKLGSLSPLASCSCRRGWYES
jgi:phage terminase large subunit-like protein